MKSYELRETKNPDIDRVVDRNGNWATYYHKPSDTYLRGVTSILDGGYARPELERWLSSHTAQERDDILAAAGEKGDMVHRAIDLMLSGDGKLSRTSQVFNRETGEDRILANDEWDTLLAFESFWKAHEPVLYVSEATVFSLKHSYAGTTDALLKLTKACSVKTCKCEELVGKIGVWDWKTSSGIRASYSAQGAAYAHADNIKDYLPKKNKVAYIGVLRLGTKHKTTGGYELKSFDPKEGYVRFMAAKQIADYDFDPFTPENITDIPEEITLKVEAYVPPSAKKQIKARKTLAKDKTI